MPTDETACASKDAGDGNKAATIRGCRIGNDVCQQGARNGGGAQCDGGRDRIDDGNANDDSDRT